jgi:predicted O-linked N-acetylglucosamine transferase (SPINDLY family)
VYRPLVGKADLRSSTRYRVQQTPALNRRRVTFGSCNNLAKITDQVIDAWSKILNQVPDSRLLIESPGLSQREFKEHMVLRFAAHGVPAERLDLRERDSGQQYLIYNEIDICLDPFPCNGGTTSLDLLWMGVPLVTLEGDAFVSRMGVTWLTNLGRHDLIAATVEQYVEIAVQLAADVQGLDAQRQDQRGRMESSPLMDEELFGEQFTDLLWALAETGTLPLQQRV